MIPPAEDHISIVGSKLVFTGCVQLGKVALKSTKLDCTENECDRRICAVR